MDATAAAFKPSGLYAPVSHSNPHSHSQTYSHDGAYNQSYALPSSGEVTYSPIAYSPIVFTPSAQGVYGQYPAQSTFDAQTGQTHTQNQTYEQHRGLDQAGERGGALFGQSEHGFEYLDQSQSHSHPHPQPHSHTHSKDQIPETIDGHTEQREDMQVRATDHLFHDDFISAPAPLAVDAKTSPTAPAFVPGLQPYSYPAPASNPVHMSSRSAKPSQGQDHGNARRNSQMQDSQEPSDESSRKLRLALGIPDTANDENKRPAQSAANAHGGQGKKSSKGLATSRWADEVNANTQDTSARENGSKARKARGKKGNEPKAVASYAQPIINADTNGDANNTDIQPTQPTQDESTAQTQTQPDDQAQPLQPIQRVQAVRGNRSATGGPPPPKLSEQELASKMEAISLKNKSLEAAFARSQADEQSSAQREHAASLIPAAERRERQAMMGEREKNRARKLNAMGGREWDADKTDEVETGYTRGVNGGVAR